MRAIIIKYLANTITVSRIVISLIIIFTIIFSREFYSLYILGGISDIIDGFIARKTHTESKFGAILDSIADLVFLVIISIKIIPSLLDILPKWVLCTIPLIATIRFSAYLIAALKYHKFIALHTISNKITGLTLFLIPCVSFLIDINIISIIICVLAGVSSIEELVIDIKSKNSDSNIRSFLEI